MATSQPFPVQESSVDIRNPAYDDARSKWKQVLQDFQERLQEVSLEGTAAACSKHLDRGQLLPRNRIALLLDFDSPFLELGPFAGHRLPNSNNCANIIAGIGTISGRPCLLMSHIPTQDGGAWNEYTVQKVNRIMEIGMENDLPLISLVQSQGKPSCAIVFGSSTAGGAYHPALSDYTIFVKDQAQVFLAGPPLVKMATGETVEAEELGGANMHATMTGLADQIAVDEFDAIQKAREWVATLHVPDPRSTLTHYRAGDALPPRYPIQDLLSLVDPDIRKPFDMREVLLRLVDDSRLLEFKPKYGPSILTARAHILGFPVGIVANQRPIIHVQEALKATQFIRTCNQELTPIIFLHNVTGFMVGSKAEHAGIIKAGAQLVSAVSCSRVPHISIIMGSSYGAGNYAMAGRSYKPRFLFSWPTGRCSVMGPDQLAGVMETIQRGKARGSPGDPSASGTAKKAKATAQELRDQAAKDAECYATSAVLIDDGVIDPRDTREVLGMCLEVVRLPTVEETSSHGLLARI
ncbi:carboxyl transferase domain-containing protein [Diaporthe helianthi]|uniref:methylcrotonoyl-CoA carboxylase n=1 Tax=Diaporthe helianthi TaxID=158607 RepID=A0A2P5I797_DIAHE|nr:carboxyl transferase domain-containing protein [Diaporthe helianthi]